MKEIFGTHVQVGDLIIPFVSHPYKMGLNSLFGLMVSDKKVFTLNTTTNEYSLRDCDTCLKVKETDFDGNTAGIRKRLSIEYKKMQSEAVRIGKATTLKLGQVYKRPNVEDRAGLPIYYIYLGKVKVSVLSNSGNYIVTGNRGYIIFNNKTIRDRATAFEKILNYTKSNEVSLENLLFDSFLHTDVRISRNNDAVCFKHIVDVRDRALTHMTYVGDIVITDFKDSNRAVVNTTKDGSSTLIYVPSSVRDDYYLVKVCDFDVVFELLE